MVLAVELMMLSSLCADLDECAQKRDRCGESGICRNLIGDYMCDCKPGYNHTTSDKKTCHSRYLTNNLLFISVHMFYFYVLITANFLKCLFQYISCVLLHFHFAYMFVFFL